MRQWSTYCQNADFLEKSRMLIMNRDMSSQVAGWIGLKSSDNVLDVGCGSGELTFYLAEATKEISYTGVDLDMPLLERAQLKADTYSGSCNLSFVRGNAVCLPFDDASFDVVVSQTLLTSIYDYEKVMQEMRRVCRPGGRIAALNPISFRQIYQHAGNYPADATWATSYNKCMGTLERLYNAYGTMEQYAAGIIPMKVPELFAHAGLEHVKAYPIGSFLSLSNDAMTKEDKRRYILLDHKSEMEKFSAYMELPEANDWVSVHEANEIKEAFAKRRDYLLEHLDDNRIWEWMGTTSLLVVGEYTKQDISASKEECLMDELRAETDKYRKILENLHVEIQEKWHHSGAGRTASVSITVEGTDICVKGVGVTPAHAAAHGYRLLMGALAAGTKGSYEKSFTAKKLDELGGKLLEETLNRGSKGPGAPLLDFRTTEQKMNAWDFSAVDGEYAALPFERIADGQVKWLPEVLRSAYYGDNGIGVGLTEQDAVVDGLCDIAKHYAVRKTLVEGQTPPLLPEEMIHTLPEVLQEAICALQHSKTCCLRLMDASCGIGLPVVAAMLIDQKRGTAILKFGAHPKLDEALSCCIAELMADQGYDSPVNMKRVDMTQSEGTNYPRCFNHMNGQSDVYPASIVNTTSSWEYRPWKAAEDDVLGHMLTLYQELGGDIYIGRYPFIDISAVQVIVPGISMLYDFGTIRMHERKMADTVKYSFRNMANVSAEEQKRAMQYAQLKMGWRKESSFASLTGISYTPMVLGVPLDAAMIYGLLQLRDGAYDTALEILKHYSYDSLGNPLAVQVLCEMIKNISSGADMEQLKSQLAVMYSDEWVKAAAAILDDPLGALPVLTCPDCKNCSVKNNCKAQKTVGLMQRIRNSCC